MFIDLQLHGTGPNDTPAELNQSFIKVQQTYSNPEFLDKEFVLMDLLHKMAGNGCREKVVSKGIHVLLELGSKFRARYPRS